MATTDVTERPRDESDLRLLAAVVESAHDAIYVRTPDGAFSTWNRGAERLYGYAAAEAIGQHVWTIVPPDCRGELEEKHARLLRGELVEPFETRRVRKDAQPVFVSIALSAIVGAEGRVVGIAAIARAVPPHKPADEALNDALAYAENIVDTVREPLLVLDGRLRVRTANRSFYRAFQVTMDDTEGRLVYELGNGQWDIPRLRTLLEEILPENTSIDDFEVTHAFPGIGSRVMLVNARRMYRGGNDTELILLAIEDITERRRLEDERRELETRFTSLVQNVRDHSIFTTDPQGRITSWNAEAEKILGFSEVEALGQHFSIIFTPEDQAAGIPANELATALSEGRAEDERWHARKGGERFWALGIVTPTQDARGAHTGYSKILRDMTDRKRAEEALRREHEFSESLVDTARTIVLVLDREGGIVRFNSYLEELTGWRLDEVQGKDWFETFLPERDRPKIRDLFGRALGGERVLGNVNSVVTKDGRERDIEWFDAPLTLAEGGLIGLLGTGQDITERKRAEQALRAAHGRLEAVIEAAPSLIVVTDRAGRVVHFNPACEELTGYRRDEVLGDTLLDRFVPAEWRSVVAARFADPHAPELREPHENPWLTRGGDERLIEWRCITLSQPDETSPWFLVGFGIDVTERKRAEEALRASEARYRRLSEQLNLVTDTIAVPVIHCSRDLRYLWVSKPCAEWLGRPADEIVGRPIIDVLGPAAFDQILPHIQSVLSGREVRYEEEVDYLGLGRRWINAAYEPTFDEAGAPDGWVAVIIDVTDRKRMEQALAQRVAQQAAVAALGQKALAERDLQGLMNEAVQSVAEVLGVEYCKALELLPSGHELLLRAGVGWREGLVGHATVGACQDSQAGYTLLSTESVVVDDLRTETRLRAPRLLDEHGVVSGMSCRIAGPAGQPFGVLGAHTSQPRHFTSEDVFFLEAVANLLGSVIQRRHFEEGLQQSEAKHRAVVDTAVDAIITIDEQGIVQTVNPAAERSFGYAAGEMIGRNVKLLMPSPYREEHDGYLARYRATGEKRIIGIGREVVGLRKDGTTFPIDLAVAEARFGDQRLFIGFIRDITERKQTEERFRLVVESAPNAIVMVNAEGNIALVNSQAERFFGYSREELIGEPVEILVPERFRGNHRGYRASFFASPSIRPMGAGRNLYGRRKDGSEFPVEIGLTPIQTAEGFLFLSAIVDISERKQAEEELQRTHNGLKELVTQLQAKNEEVRATTQQLWQAAKLASVGELAASIAHELNNPLATMTLRIESLLEDAPGGDPNRRTFEIIQQETRRMSTLVANLLQFARRGPEQISTVDIRRELAGAVELVDRHFEKRQIAIAQELAPDTPLIYADRQKLRQVFLNLFTNAGDAMPQGGTLTLRSRAETLPGGEAAVRIEVADTGTGIPPDLLAKVFEPYFTTKEEGQGTGLGLGICRRIVEDHHGTIQIGSEAGKGTAVTIVLPVRYAKNGNSTQGHLRIAGGQDNAEE